MVDCFAATMLAAGFSQFQETCQVLHCFQGRTSAFHIHSNCLYSLALTNTAFVCSDETFALSLDDLQSQYKKLQWRLHPDRFAGAPEAERVLATNASAAISDAYNTLRSPLRRGLHLLELADATVDENANVDDMQLLMEVMEFNEEIEDADGDHSTLSEVLQRLEDKLDTAVAEVELQFYNDDIAAARTAIIKLRYYQNIYELCREIMVK